MRILMEILEKLWEWRFPILVGVTVSLLGWQKTKILLYQLMLQAKRLAKDAILNSGKEQEEWVLTNVLQLLPFSLKVILSDDLIRKIIRWLYHQAKDYADDGQLNSSI